MVQNRAAEIEGLASNLVKVINDQTSSLEKKFDALTTITQSGLANVSVKINETNQTLDVKLTDVNASLGTINTTLFNGFKTLDATIDATGNNIVYAMNSKGEILRLQIDATGKLISAEIKQLAADLIKVINSQTLTLKERIDALTTVVSSGLADVKVGVDKTNNTLDVKLTNIDKTLGTVNSSLGTINTTIFDGFKATNQTMTATGDKIITAMNANGEILRLQIDTTGKLISSEIMGTKDAIVKALNDQTIGLNANFSALNTLIESGFAKVTTKIGNVGDMLNLSIQGIGTSIGTLNTAMTQGFTLVGTKIDANGNTIATAINKEGTILEAALEKNGTVISTAIKDFGIIYANKEDAKITAMANIAAAIKVLTDANNANVESLVKILTIMLADNGIYKDVTDSTSVYMDPSLWSLVENLGEKSEAYQAIANSISGIPDPEIICVQHVPNGIHQHGEFTRTSESGSNLVVKDMKPMALANGKTVYQLIKVPSVIYYQVNIMMICAYPTIYKITVTDAKGTNREAWTGGSRLVTDVALYPYYKGKLVTTIDADAYCK